MHVARHIAHISVVNLTNSIHVRRGNKLCPKREQEKRREGWEGIGRGEEKGRGREERRGQERRSKKREGRGCNRRQ